MSLVGLLNKLSIFSRPKGQQKCHPNGLDKKAVLHNSYVREAKGYLSFGDPKGIVHSVHFYPRENGSESYFTGSTPFSAIILGNILRRNGYSFPNLNKLESSLNGETHKFSFDIGIALAGGNSDGNGWDVSLNVPLVKDLIEQLSEKNVNFDIPCFIPLGNLGVKSSKDSSYGLSFVFRAGIPVSAPQFRYSKKPITFNSLDESGMPIECEDGARSIIGPTEAGLYGVSVYSNGNIVLYSDLDVCLGNGRMAFVKENKCIVL